MGTSHQKPEPYEAERRALRFQRLNDPRKQQDRPNWRWLKRRYLPRWWPTDGATVLFNPGGVRTTRYRYRGKSIPTPWEEGVLATSESALPLKRLEGLIAR